MYYWLKDRWRTLQQINPIFGNASLRAVAHVFPYPHNMTLYVVLVFGKRPVHICLDSIFLFDCVVVVISSSIHLKANGASRISLSQSFRDIPLNTTKAAVATATANNQCVCACAYLKRLMRDRPWSASVMAWTSKFNNENELKSFSINNVWVSRVWNSGVCVCVWVRITAIQRTRPLSTVYPTKCPIDIHLSRTEQQQQQHTSHNIHTRVLALVHMCVHVSFWINSIQNACN